jgi:autophagy-related protein 17
MASPGSPASSGGSKSYRDPDPYPPPAPGLEDLVSHFVAAKRALNIQTALWRANDMVTAARELLEENAILSAKNVSVRNIVDEQTDSLEAARRGMHLVQAEVQTEFEVAGFASR